MGTQPPPQKVGGDPKFSDHAYCGQTAGWIKMALGMEVGLSLGDFVLDGDQPPLPKGCGAPPQFLSNFYCAQTAGFITMPLGMEVRLSPGDFVLDEDPAPLPVEQRAPPIFIRAPSRWATAHISSLCLLQIKTFGDEWHRLYTGQPPFLLLNQQCQITNLNGTRMWANAQRDGRPAEHRWRPLFNGAKFG